MMLRLLGLLLIVACAGAPYRSGMHREDVYERVDQLEMGAFVSEVRLGQRHDLIVVPQGGLNRQIDDELLAGGRTTFSNFRPTETDSEQYRLWLEKFHAVRLWHAVLLEDLRVIAVIDDEIHDRLIDRVGVWMQDNVNPNFNEEVLDVIRVREN